MKRLLVTFLTALLFWAGLSAQGFQPYLSESDVKNSVQLLPPPPQEGSVEFLLDKITHWTYFRERTADPARARQAIEDARMSDIGLKFKDAFGLEITEEKMPETYLLVMRSRECFGSAGCSAAKRYYNRTRPFVYFSCPTLVPGDEEWLRTNGSYPSGHTANFFGIAYVLAELRPERAEALLARADEGGISRLIVGVHWASDVKAGRMVAASVYEYLKQNKAYRAQFKKAQAEVKRLLAKQETGKAKVQPYLEAKDLPDATVFLPAPPEEGSPMLASDTLMYFHARNYLREGERGRRAVREATTDVDTMALMFSKAFGRTLTKETTPKTLHLLQRAVRTFRLSAAAPKATYMRLRPFVFYHDPTLIPEDEEYERNTGSYPSGHSVRGWGMALVLSALNPERQDAILQAGYEWGQSRVIAGYHWQSDVDASRMLASACFARLQDCEEFREDFEAAQEELSGEED
ncbi:MAG: phosphatase PAP2 family protein [Bacteroidales bacterium]|nr:phosphatase PAP2 family protein [Bacteroidales bacterium]